MMQCEPFMPQPLLMARSMMAPPISVQSTVTINSRHSSMTPTATVWKQKQLLMRDLNPIILHARSGTKGVVYGTLATQ